MPVSPAGLRLAPRTTRFRTRTSHQRSIMPHVVLLGDSIFDNASYVAGGPDVVTHLRGELPDGWQATLSAIDGATTQSMPIQYGRIPDDATHLVLSIGGNDALMNVDILDRRASSAGEALWMLADIRDAFAA